MKRNKIIILIVSFGLVLVGCKKSYIDINTNPNVLTSSTPDYVFTSGLNRTASIIGPNELGEYWSGHWTQSTTYAYSSATFSYQFNNTNFNYWDTWYDVLEDFQYVIDNADGQGLPQFKGPAKVMKAYLFQQVVDCYGNAPYSDAFKGSLSIAPKFDDQIAIYDSLIILLDAAIVDIRANLFTGATSSADIVFGKSGTPATQAINWVRFANSLKMRILIRQSRVASRAAYIVAEINKAAATPEGFLAIGQDVRSNPGYAQSAGQTNPIYNSWGYTAAGAVLALARYPRPTTFLFQQLIATDDTFRLKRLAYARGGENPNNSGVSTQPEILANYVGVPYGAPSGYLAQNTSYIGPSFITKAGFNKDIYLMLATESFFCLAEAKQVFPAVALPGTAQSYYEQGVKESFRVTGTTANPATTILVNGKNLSDWSASPDKLKAIWFQKWVALTNFSGLEAWSDYRRTNFPVLPASQGAPIGQKLPLRLIYPNTELASNGVNVIAQGTIDVFATRIFWDVD